MKITFEYDSHEDQHIAVEAQTGQGVGFAVALDDPAHDVGGHRLEASIETAFEHGIGTLDELMVYLRAVHGDDLAEADVIAMIRHLGGPLSGRWLSELLPVGQRPPRPDVGCAGRKVLAEIAAGLSDGP